MLSLRSTRLFWLVAVTATALVVWNRLEADDVVTRKPLPRFIRSAVIADRYPIEDPALGSHICGARVVDKGRNYPIFKVELWIGTKDASVREKIRERLVETMTHGLPSHKVARNGPRFEWKDHS